VNYNFCFNHHVWLIKLKTRIIDYHTYLYFCSDFFYFLILQDSFFCYFLSVWRLFFIYSLKIGLLVMGSVCFSLFFIPER
jgi:predicted transglutaminase-like protease